MLDGSPWVTSEGDLKVCPTLAELLPKDLAPAHAVLCEEGVVRAAGTWWPGPLLTAVPLPVLQLPR